MSKISTTKGEFQEQPTTFTKPPRSLDVKFPRFYSAEVPIKTSGTGTSLVAQWLRLRASNAGGPGSIPGQGTRSHMHTATKSSHATTKEPMSCN